MKLFILEHKWFYIPYLLVMLILGYLVVEYPKWEIHLWMNQFHSVFWDIFFKYLTYFGDGAFLPLFIGIMMLIRFRFAFMLLIIFLFSGIVVQLLKHVVFNTTFRPVEMLKEGASLHLVQGTKLLSYNSFPSGHAATAFGILICFAFVFKQEWIKVLMLIFACLIAYSRVYLSQHFLIDIMAGSLIGVISASFSFFYLSDKPWLDGNVFTITKL